MTVSSVKRRRLTVRVSRAYARFIGWGRRHRWLFIVALIWGFGIPTFLLPEKIEPEKGETPGRGTELYNKIMEGRFMTEHRSFLDKFLGSSPPPLPYCHESLQQFQGTGTEGVYVNARYGPKDVSSSNQRRRTPWRLTFATSTRWICSCTRITSLLTRLSHRDHVQARIVISGFFVDVKQSRRAQRSALSRSDMARLGHRRQFVQQQHRHPTAAITDMFGRGGELRISWLLTPTDSIDSLAP